MQDGYLVLTTSSLITRGIYNLCQLHQYGPSSYYNIINVNINGDKILFNNNHNNWKINSYDYGLYSGKII